MKISLSILLVLLAQHCLFGQVLISLIFGDKLNSDKIEFGLEGGAVFTTLTDIPDAENRIAFDLGFYFNIRLKERLFLGTGVLVKSPMGVDGIAPYPTGDSGLDLLLEDGAVLRKLGYFNVPAMLHYRFKSKLFAEGGVQLGLLNKAVDEFYADVNGGELLFERDVKSVMAKFDMGLVAGMGYRLMEGKSLQLGVRYYEGLLDVMKETDGVRNRALYLFARLPIGAGKKIED